MAYNKVVLGGETKLDLTSDTVEAAYLLSGVTAHDKSGAQIVGTLVANYYYSGNSAPSDSLGNDGDFYVQMG